MKPDYIARAVVGLFCAGWMTGSALAQNYPDKPIRLIVPYSPGGGADTMARIVGRKATDVFGQQIVVDNRGGAGGNLAAKIATQSNPDGYTIFQGGVAHTMSVSLYRKLDYDFVKDLAPVTELASMPFILMLNASVRANSVQELVALAKASPGKLNYGSSGSGGPSHLAVERLKAITGTDIRHIPYKGSGPATIDLVSGQIQMMFFTVAPALPHIKAKRLRALGIASAKRTPLAPQIPTMAEAGIQDLEVSTWYGVMVPAGTPDAVIATLHKGFVAALNAPDVTNRLASVGYELVGSTPRVFAAYIQSEIARWAKVIKDAGVTLN